MKIITICVLLALFIGCSPEAPYLNPRVLKTQDWCTRAHCSYVHGLYVNNPGVMESAMMYLVKLKMQYPELKCDKELRQIDYLAIRGMTPSLRYRAFLTGFYLRYPNAIESKDFYLISRDDSEFFTALSGDLNEHILGLRMPE